MNSIPVAKVAKKGSQETKRHQLGKIAFAVWENDVRVQDELMLRQYFCGLPDAFVGDILLQ